MADSPIIALLAPHHSAERVFSQEHIASLQSLGKLVDARFSYRGGVAEVAEKLAPVEIVVSTWGMPRLDEQTLALLPKLRAVFYAAGSVKGWATPEAFERGVIVSSAAPANAIPVAEYTVAVIVLANKRFWSHMRQTKKVPMPGNYRRTVGIIGASMVGREVLRLLKGYELSVLLYDPFVDAGQAAALGARLVSLPELMAESDVVSLHAPNLPHLRHMINGELLALMKDGATFINTARGALVDEEALLKELTTGRIWAVLDVTDPEPPVPGSPLYTLPNVIYTPHIAGSMDAECYRMAEFALAELQRYLQGQPLQNEVKQAALAYLA